MIRGIILLALAMATQSCSSAKSEEWSIRSDMENISSAKNMNKYIEKDLKSKMWHLNSMSQIKIAELIVLLKGNKNTVAYYSFSSELGIVNVYLELEGTEGCQSFLILTSLEVISSRCKLGSTIFSRPALPPGYVFDDNYYSILSIRKGRRMEIFVDPVSANPLPEPDFDGIRNSIKDSFIEPRSP